MNNNKNNKNSEQDKEEKEEENKDDRPQQTKRTTSRAKRSGKDFLEGLTAEEASLFIEHARDDDMPSTSREAAKRADRTRSLDRSVEVARYAQRLFTRNRSPERSSGKVDRPLNHRATDSDTETVASGRSGSYRCATRNKNRRAKPPATPSRGQPGGLDDHRRSGLRGASAKWYLQYLEEGKPPEAARSLAARRMKPKEAENK